jgi:carbon monoxide dehydrogenase subunit G
MKVEQSFRVAATPTAVFSFLDDIPSVAACLPGATLGERSADGAWSGTVAVSLGPLDMTFEGTATITTDADARTGQVSGSGVDKRGGSRGRIEITYSVVGEGTGSQVAIDADLTLAGPAAQFGRTGLIEEIARRLMTDFAGCLEARLAGGAGEDAVAAGSIKGGRLLVRSVLASIGSFFRRIFGRG